jgi:hypothetical protein
MTKTDSDFLRAAQDAAQCRKIMLEEGRVRLIAEPHAGLLHTPSGAQIREPSRIQTRRHGKESR